jgi:tRNA threonylcarbamoyladenosine biosynthesis protein TsaB
VNVLGLDAATAGVGACAIGADGRVAERVPSPERLLGRPAHARELMPALAAVTGEAGLDFAALDLIAVGRGPGSFTGVRIALATARALGQAHGVSVAGVGSLAALAAGARTEAGEAPVLALIDARRGELFAALHAGGEARWAPFAATPDALLERLPELSPAPLGVGDGSLRCRAMLEAAGVRVPPPESPLHAVRGRWVCELAMTAPHGGEPATPLYLREPDARPIA